MSTVAGVRARSFQTDIPARLDRLPWSRWHWRVIIALGITWVIDGLEVTLVGAISPVLERPETLRFTSTQNGLLNTAYLVGAVSGALVFGYLTDLWGRKKLFTVTLGLYLTAAFLTALSWDFWSFAVFRFFTGAGIGGEYSAINSAIDELIPARVRGWADLAINGTFWVGAAAGSLATIVLLDPRWLPVDLGWRLGFGIGALLGLIIIFFRNSIPESPRWLMVRGDKEEAERIVGRIEREIEAEPGVGRLPAVDRTITIRPQGPIGFGTIARTMLEQYPRRMVLGLTMIMSQAFLYNGVSFAFALILAKFYGVSEDRIGLLLLPFALGNFLGPLLLGRLFDTVGRKPMIAGTYAVSAVLLIISGFLFERGLLNPWTQTLIWSVIFFFASAAASSAYLTVSEIFPLELRGLAIALFYATGTAIGGPLASWLFGRLLDHGKPLYDASGRLIRAARPHYIFDGDLLAAAILMVAVVVVALFGVKAERTSLEDIAAPLSAAADTDLEDSSGPENPHTLA
ncbi:MAG: MFS transporter, partial [Isosphaeraceae bacterium]|nr:MFS transporter [Isosphaeraceae bacterium]